MSLAFATEVGGLNRENEDFVGATPDAVVVLDGAGYPARLPTGCVHTVAWYTRMLGSSLLSTLTTLSTLTSDDRPLAEVLANGIETVSSLHSSTCDLAHPGSPAATVLLLRRTTESLDWLVLADSILVLDLNATAEPMVVSDDRLADVTATLRTHLDTLPTGSTEHEQARLGSVEAQLQHRNRDGGYWVASTDPLAAEHSLTGSVPTDAVRAAALLSDGASRLVDCFELASWRRLLNILEDDGPAGLINQVRTAERTDPHGARWPRGKAHDDATAVYWRL
ncbi:integrase [Nonomuraea sp. NPDC050022]|uniref:integrase n=1 Tax=unclassified Nonomuraea TaxID=2593643 RepID=UPI0033F78EED